MYTLFLYFIGQICKTILFGATQNPLVGACVRPHRGKVNCNMHKANMQMHATKFEELQ